jgi:hypothetical protein
MIFMEKSTNLGYRHSYAFKCKSIIGLWVHAFTAVFFFGLLLSSSPAFSQSANLDQIRNGMLGVYSPTPVADWVNGNAGPSNAHFAEGYSIPYRVQVSGLVGNSSTVHHLIIEWDTKHGNGHAIDYITHYQNLDNPTGSHLVTFGHGAEEVTPTLGTVFSGAPTQLFQIPAPSSAGSEKPNQPTLSFNALVARTGFADITKMAIWGGTIVSLNYVFEDAPDGITAQTETRLDIAFRSTNGSTALIAWAGHIAAEYDWGAGRGATGVSGSPYHTRIIEIDGKPGNQDRSLKATAVIIPPAVCGISPAQTACPETPSLTFSATGSSTGADISYVWTLTNGSTSAGAKIDPGTGNTGFTVKVVPTGSAFLAGGTFNLSLTVSKTGAQSKTCEQIPAGTIDAASVEAKVAATAAGAGSTTTLASPFELNTLLANPQAFLKALGTLNTVQNNSLFSSFTWAVATLPAGTINNATTSNLSSTSGANVTFTPTAAQGGGFVSGIYAFEVTATSSGNGCVAKAKVYINASGTANCVKPSGPIAVCENSTDLAYSVSPSSPGANLTYVWSIVGTGTTIDGADNVNGAGTKSGVGNITVDAGTSSFKVKLSIKADNGFVFASADCELAVTVKAKPTVTTQYNAPACNSKKFTVDVLDAKKDLIYSIDQPDNTTDFSGQTVTATSDGQAIKFIDLVAGEGFIVTVSNGLAGCSTTSSCDNNTPVCPSDAGKTQVSTNINEVVARTSQSYNIVLESGTKVNAVPNPYTDKVKFNLNSGVSGYGSLELYNTLGQKVAVVYQGYVKAGTELSKEYLVPRANRSTLIYVFRVGEQQVTGKLIGLK